MMIESRATNRDYCKSTIHFHVCHPRQCVIITDIEYGVACDDRISTEDSSNKIIVIVIK